MGIGETYTALQTGVIDGIESPADGLWNFKIPEVAQHSSKTYHMFTDMNLLMSKDKFGSLSADEQKILRDAAREVVVDWYRKDVAGNDQKFWAMIAEKTEEVDNPDLESFRKATAPVYETFYKQAGPKGRAFVEAVMKAA
jgi:TRAP-type C4-dicarboxylate transport system substrate-binding protein